MVNPINKLRDWFGRAVPRAALDGEQSSKVGGIAQEFEGHPSRGLNPARLASIMTAAEQGDITDQLDLGEDMEEKDTHIFAELSKRKRAILGLDWKILPPRNASAAEKRAAEQLQEWFEDIPDFEDHLLDMGDAIHKGFSNLEIEWRLEGRHRLPRLRHRPPRWFTINKDNRDQLLLRREHGMGGDELRPFGWVSHIHKAKSGYVARANLIRVLAWPYLFKNYSVRDLAEFLEIYGLPVRLGEYPAGASEREKLTLLRAVTQIGHNAAGIIPQGMSIDFKEAAKGSSDPFQAMMAWCEASESKAILGGTLTTTAEATGLGSDLGDVHNEVRLDLRVSDARQMGGTLTRDLAWPMVALNIEGITPDRAPRFVFVTEEEEDKQARAERDKILFDMGYRPTPDKVKEVYGEGYERIETPPLPPGEGRGEGEESDTAAAKAEAKADAAPDIVDQYTAQAQENTATVVDAMLSRIRQLLEEANSFEEFEAALIANYSHLDEEGELPAVMQLAMSVAELAGRYEVEQEAEEDGDG